MILVFLGHSLSQCSLFIPNSEYILVTEQIPTRNPILVYLELAEKWIEGKLNKAFLHFHSAFDML